MATFLQNRKETEDFLLKFYSLQDDRKLSNFPTLFSLTAILKFANYPALEGLDTIVAFFTTILSLLASTQHTLIYFDVVANKIYNHSQLRVFVAGDAEKQEFVLEAFSTLFVSPEGLVDRAEVYVDFSPVMARIGMLAQVKGT